MPLPNRQAEYEIVRTIDEIQGILKVLDKDALFRFINYDAVHFSKEFTKRGQHELSDNFRDLAESCIIETGGEELGSYQSRWDYEDSLFREIVEIRLAAYSRILVRNGKRDSKPGQWITYILGKL